MKSIVRVIGVFCIILGLIAAVSGFKTASIRRVCIGGMTITVSAMSLISVNNKNDKEYNGNE